MDPTGLTCIRLDDANGPCAGAIKTKNGRKQYQTRQRRWKHQTAIARAKYEATKLLNAAQNGRVSRSLLTRMQSTQEAVSSGIGISEQQAQQDEYIAVTNTAPLPYEAPKSACHGFWGCLGHYTKQTMDVISTLTPLLDTAALVFGEVPILGQVLIVAAIVANAIATVDSFMNAVGEYSDHGFTASFALDVTGFALGIIGLGALGQSARIARGVESSAPALRAASKAASARPWSYKAVNARDAAQAMADVGRAKAQSMRAISTGVGWVGDGLTHLCNVSTIC